MRFLLDTHIVLAALEGIDAVDKFAREALSRKDATFFVSVASIWEIAIKYRLGKLALNQSPATLPARFQSMSLKLLLINEHHALAEIDPEPATRDPFDRLLLAQCQIEDLRLVTLDRALVTHPLAWRRA